MFNKAKNTPTQLSGLSKEKIESICHYDPEWVHANAPHLLFSVRPDWCFKFKPFWTFMNYTNQMVKENPAWCSYFYPAEMASLDWDRLVQYNPGWAMEFQLERLLRTNPELIGYYSQSYLNSASTTIKPKETVFSSWKIWKKNKSKGQDVTIPKNIQSIITEPSGSLMQV